jgi:formaldehyde-activating enzyme involved in methanogenesis
MLKSILAAALLTSVLASGAMAAAPAVKPAVAAKPATVLVHKVAMKKPMMKMCKKGAKLVKGKCVASKM